MIPIANVVASGPVDGMDEKHPEGSYIRFYVDADGQPARRYRISRGAAEALIAELQGALARHPPATVNNAGTVGT